MLSPPHSHVQCRRQKFHLRSGMLEDRRENPSFTNDPCSLSPRFRDSSTNRSPITCSWTQDVGRTDVFCQRPRPVGVGPWIQSSSKIIDKSSEDFDFGRSVNDRGLLPRAQVGACTTLFGALCGRDGDARHLETVLDDELWYVTTTATLLTNQSPPHYTVSYTTCQNDLTKSVRI